MHSSVRYRLSFQNSFRGGNHTHSRKGLEAVVRKDVDSLTFPFSVMYLSIHPDTHTVICLQIIDLLAEYENPQVFTQKFYHIERVREAWPVLRKALYELSDCARAGHCRLPCIYRSTSP